MEPVLLIVTKTYEILNPSFNMPAIKHKFGVCFLQFCLINQLNLENIWSVNRKSKHEVYLSKILNT